MAGQVINGVVHVVLQKPLFEVQNLTIGLYGSEHVQFRKAHRRGKSTVYKSHFGYFEIIQLVFPLQTYPDGPPKIGQMSFPFSLVIPDWLPASMMLAGDLEEGRLSVEYSLRAQFTPKHHCDWADVKHNISSFKGTRMVYIYRPVLQQPQVNLRMELHSEVGGFLGMGTSVCHSEIFFDKNQYYLGEVANVRIICDNSRCAKGISSFKFKLMRHYKGIENPGHYHTECASYLVSLKNPGLGKGEKCERMLQLRIPTEDKVAPR